MKRILLALLFCLTFSVNLFGIEYNRNKNSATYIIFPMIDSSDDVSFKSSAAALDSEKDTYDDVTAPDGFADCTNEATEIGSTGIYYLLLTALEMDFDYVIIQIKSSDANTQAIVISTILKNSIDNIGAAGGGSLYFSNEGDNVDSPIKSITFVGAETSGTNASVHAEDGTYHQIDDDGNDIDIVYQFDVGGGRTANEVLWKGYLNGNNDVATIQVYNGSSWDTVFTITGKPGSGNDVESIPLLSTHTGTSTDLGKVFIRIECDTQSNPTLYTDQLIVGAVNIGQSIGYADGAIWVDTGASNTNTEAFVDGVADNPVSSWAAALTLSSSLNITRFRIINGSSITLTGAITNYTMIGENWTLALGSQSVTGASITGASVTGVCTGTNFDMHHCILGSGTDLTIADGNYYDCSLAGSIILTGATTYYFDKCFSGIAGTSTPDIDFGAAVGSQNVNFRHYSGGIEIKNIGQTGTDNMSLEGHGQYILNANCTGGTLAVRGHFKKTDNSDTTSVVETVNYDPITEVADAIWDEAIAGHTAEGSTGEALSNASAAGDPWATDLPGSYSGDDAGKKLNDMKVRVDAINP